MYYFYFVFFAATSDGSQSGMDRLKGGVCTRFSMKIELRIQSKDGKYCLITTSLGYDYLLQFHKTLS